MKSAYEISAEPRDWEPPARIAGEGLTDAQCAALMTLFFAGEMTRARGEYVAEGSHPIKGQTVDVLHRKGLVKLGVERRHMARRRNVLYRYFVALTDRGEWFATTMLRQREVITAALADVPPAAPDAIDDVTEVYAEAAE